MTPLGSAVRTALQTYIERITGVRPALKPSKKAHLATGSFLPLDAENAARLLNAHTAECTLCGVPLLRSVSVENGWLLFFFTTDALDAYAAALPDAEEPDDGYVSRRLWMIARRPDAPVPDDGAVLSGFFAALFGLPDGERLFLSAPRDRNGTARIQLEQRMTRLAKLLLYERRNNV